MMKGIAASPGIAIGRAWVMEDTVLNLPTDGASDVESEITRFKGAVEQARQEIEALKEKTLQDLGEDKAAIFDAHLMVLDDPELVTNVENKIKEERLKAENAVNAVMDAFIAVFENMDMAYMRERAADLRDVRSRLLHVLLGVERRSLAELSEPVIVVAHDLTPSDTAQMDKRKVLGFTTNIGGRTSHSAIMARSLEIPAVVGLKTVVSDVKQGDTLIVDGLEGVVIINPSEDQLADYRKKQRAYEAEKVALEKLIHEPSVTADGVQVELAANIGTPDEAEAARARGAEGIGLFRTEFLYMDRSDLPGEEEQFNAYKQVAEAMGDDPVVIRTLDIGGDKELPYLKLPEERNPFLGYRAIRLCLDRTDLFKTQLRAILRASAFGNIKMMYPMIATLDEWRAANRVLDDVKEELRKEGTPFNEAIEVGIMVEIPAAAVIADQLAKEVDFFSIGTNDLIQYTLAADRMNEHISYLYQPFHPAVIRLVKHVIDAAHAEGKWVGMCGEMAGDPLAIPVLLGLGLDEFSMSVTSVLPARKLLRGLRKSEMEKLAETALAKGTAEEVVDCIKETLARRV